MKISNRIFVSTFIVLLLMFGVGFLFVSFLLQLVTMTTSISNACSSISVLETLPPVTQTEKCCVLLTLRQGKVNTVNTISRREWNQYAIKDYVEGKPFALQRNSCLLFYPSAGWRFHFHLPIYNPDTLDSLQNGMNVKDALLYKMLSSGFFSKE